jgi:hypothetical protein
MSKKAMSAIFGTVILIALVHQVGLKEEPDRAAVSVEDGEAAGAVAGSGQVLPTWCGSTLRCADAVIAVSPYLLPNNKAVVRTSD